MNVTLTGWFSIYVYRADGTLKRSLTRIKNVVTDHGLNAMIHTAAQIGTSSTPPTTASTSLNGTILTSNTSPSVLINRVEVKPTAANGWRGSTTIAWRFNASVSLENTWACVGAMSSMTSTTLIAGTTIKDALGNPTTITILSGEVLEVAYTIEFQYVTPGEFSGSFSMVENGVPRTINYNMRIRYPKAGFAASAYYGMRIGQVPANGLSGVTTAPSVGPVWNTNQTPEYYATGTVSITGSCLGTGVTSPSITLYPIWLPEVRTIVNAPTAVGDSTGYVPDSHELSHTFTWASSNGNIPYVLGWHVNNVGTDHPWIPSAAFKVATLSDVFSKTNLQTLTLGMKVSWARVAY